VSGALKIAGAIYGMMMTGEILKEQANEADRSLTK
jgi:hypothetical protein